MSFTPEKFEHIIKDLLVASGFNNVSVTRYSQDGGIDINAYVNPQIWPIDNLHIQVQAKRWLHTVGRKEVAELRGSLDHFARGSLVTTSHFSKSAILESSLPGKIPITLIDGFKLAKIVVNNNLNIA